MFGLPLASVVAPLFSQLQEMKSSQFELSGLTKNGV